MEYTDMLGNDITVGCYVAYSVRSGNSGEMKIGKVLELTQTEINYWQTEPSPAIVVIGLEKNYKTYRKHSKPSTLVYLDRLVVTDTIPDEIKQLLD